MGMRFRKSLKLAPGVRMNFSGSGVSWTIGPRGASVGIGKRGTYLNTGIPGTGFSSRQRLDGGGSARRASGKTTVNATVTIHIDDKDGTISFLDSNGNPVPDSWVTAAKKQKGDLIKSMIQAECDKINSQLEALGELHLDTPNPTVPPLYQPATFDQPQPQQPTPVKPGFFVSLFKSWRDRVENKNAEVQRVFEKSLQDWETAKQAFDSQEAGRKKFIEHDIYSDTAAMSTFLEGNLQDIVWPKETDVSFDILDEGKRIFLDVDLPEIEDMPSKTASAPSRGYKLNIKDMAAGQIQKLYMRHVHGVGFRIVGETFAALPTAEVVVISAYSQRPDPATGQIGDEYLYSVRVPRPEWELIQFNNLSALDIVEAFTRFELRRKMSKTGVFKPIEPIAP